MNQNNANLDPLADQARAGGEAFGNLTLGDFVRATHAVLSALPPVINGASRGRDMDEVIISAVPHMRHEHAIVFVQSLDHGGLVAVWAMPDGRAVVAISPRGMSLLQQIEEGGGVEAEVARAEAEARAALGELAPF